LLDAGGTQARRPVKLDESETVGQGSKRFSNTLKTVAIGIRLDHAPDFGAIDSGTYALVIMRKRRKIQGRVNWPWQDP
jgi:hypothetical protein